MARRRRRNQGNDRREAAVDFRVRPPASPASMVVLLVSGVLLVSAAVAAFFGNGFGDETPHGRLLTTLDAAAQAQEGHYREQGRFMVWHETLPVEVPSDVELQVVSGTSHQWRALARAPDVGLVCSQAGGVANGKVEREQPVCYREEG